MNVLGVGPAELILILIVALVFVGPERLPRLAADLARTIREIRKYTGSLASEFNDVVKEFEKETEADRSQWKDVSEGIGSATKSVTDALKGARRDAEGAATAPPSAIPPASEAAAAEPQWRDIGEGAPPATNGNGAKPTDGVVAAPGAADDDVR